MNKILKQPPASPFYLIEAEKDKNYAICTCKKSTNMPFCDGSHKGTNLSPSIFRAEKNGPIAFCACGKSQNNSLCDGSHKN